MRCPFRAHTVRLTGRETVLPTRLGAALLCAATMCGSAWAGPDWTEPPHLDAGSTAASAQTPSGPAGPLKTIAGSTSSALTASAGLDFEDVYRIRICDPVQFCMKSFATFDSQIWLFNDQGIGILANDQGNGDDAVLYPPANDGTPTTPVFQPGVYLVAISGFNIDPIGTLTVGESGLIFNQKRREERSGPDGPGGQYPLSHWTIPGETGQYLLRLEGATFADQDCSNGPYVENPCIPALSDWGLAAMTLLLLCTATVVIARKRAAA